MTDTNNNPARGTVFENDWCPKCREVTTTTYQSDPTRKVWRCGDCGYVKDDDYDIDWDDYDD